MYLLYIDLPFWISYFAFLFANLLPMIMRILYEAVLNLVFWCFVEILDLIGLFRVHFSFYLNWRVWFEIWLTAEECFWRSSGKGQIRIRKSCPWILEIMHILQIRRLAKNVQHISIGRSLGVYLIPNFYLTWPRIRNIIP